MLPTKEVGSCWAACTKILAVAKSTLSPSPKPYLSLKALKLFKSQYKTANLRPEVISCSIRA